MLIMHSEAKDTKYLVFMIRNGEVKLERENSYPPKAKLKIKKRKQSFFELTNYYSHF